MILEERLEREGERLVYKVRNSQKKKFQKEKYKPLLWPKIIITLATTFRTNGNSFEHLFFMKFKALKFQYSYVWFS